MAPLAHNAGSMAQGNPNAILNECREIDRGVDQIEQNLEQLRMLQKRTLDDADASASSSANRQLDSLSAETMAHYRTLTERIRQVKSNPDSRTPKNNPQVGRVDRRLKGAITQYQQVESSFRKRTEEQMARQFRIIRPDASEQEVRRAIEDTHGGQVFQQALMQSARSGQARAALHAVEDRHKALVKIEEQMMELAQLFQDMDTLVIQQEPAVIQIEQKGEEVVDNLDKGNEEIGIAVKTARKTRKKKWICLGICGMFLLKLETGRLTDMLAVALIVIVVIIVLIYVFVIRGNGSSSSNNNNKRGLPANFGNLPVINIAPLQRMGVRLVTGAQQEGSAPLLRRIQASQDQI